MKPGERIRIIKESADALNGKKWQEIQLVLDQFGYQTWEDTDQTTEEYVYSVLGGDKDDDSRLGQLHEYLIGEDAAPATEHPWGEQPLKLFISHVHDDASFAGDVKRLMERHFGTSVFVAHDNIHPSKQWRDVIRSALATCDAMIALTHERFHASQWCDQEVGWALGRSVPVIPVRPGGFDRSSAADGFLEEHQDFQLTGPQREWELARRTLVTLLDHERTHATALTAAVESFVASPSFNHTRWIWPYIARITNLSGDQLRRLEYAIATNDQVYKAGADGKALPVLVEDLVKKHEPPDPWAGRTDEPPF
ncbi:MAG: toll/interleukin-1 receptor domain-containing protein [Bifidobacteriaceae bacterium]|nr:toll/interleukin-1 receptor domain-containing protein [Bifidobacteriaceae bacterium]